MVMIQGESLGQRAGTLPPPHDELVLVDAPDTDDTDNMLMVRLRAGDELAFRALVNRHRPWLERHCTRLLGHDAHAAVDAAQESLLKLHAAVLRGQPLRVRPWLTVVARNTCVDEQRRRRPDLPGELPERSVAGSGQGMPCCARCFIRRTEKGTSSAGIRSISVSTHEPRSVSTK